MGFPHVFAHCTLASEINIWCDSGSNLVPFCFTKSYKNHNKNSPPTATISGHVLIRFSTRFGTPFGILHFPGFSRKAFSERSKNECTPQQPPRASQGLYPDLPLAAPRLLLGCLGVSWGLLGLPGASWGCSWTASGRPRVLLVAALAAPGRSWLLLAAPGGSWPLLAGSGVPGRLWAFSWLLQRGSWRLLAL